MMRPMPIIPASGSLDGWPEGEPPPDTSKFQRHPLGGWTPANLSQRGALSVECERCGAVVVRDVSPDLWRISRAECECGAIACGPEAGP